MIQELFAGSNVCGRNNILDSNTPSHSPSPSSSPSSSSAAVSTAAATTTTSESLRCPRCDSSNTKFCYYNNYNLTQPRHFCKTCRRYWTKGGALRNVPIGGGCRKNRNATITAAVGKSAAAAMFKTASSGLLMSGLENAEAAALSSNPIIWAASSQNSHFLSLLRANQNSYFNQFQNSVSLKEESSIFGSSISGGGGGEMNVHASGLNPLGPTHLSSTMGLSNSSYRNQTQGIIHGDVQNNNNGLQELYQRLRSSSSAICYPEHAPIILGNVASGNSSFASAVLESAPVIATGELGFWNNPTALSWPTDLPTANGAYP